MKSRIAVLASVLAYLAVVSIAITACTDAERAALSSLGDEASITCYSGGAVIYSDTSTGKVMAGEGLFYKSKTTGRYVRNYADCIVVSK